jgi:hypothetical protein
MCYMMPRRGGQCGVPGCRSDELMVGRFGYFNTKL